MAAATATVSRAFQGELNRFCLAHRAERRTPSALHDGDTAVVPVHERGGDEGLDLLRESGELFP